MSRATKTDSKEGKPTAAAVKETSGAENRSTTIGRFAASILPTLETFTQATFNGRQFSGRLYSTATQMIKDLVSGRSMDFELAAVLDRLWAQPKIVEFSFAGPGALELPHGLAKAPRRVIPIGMEQTGGSFGWALIGWDDTNIKAAGTDGTIVRFAVYP